MSVKSNVVRSSEDTNKKVKNFALAFSMLLLCIGLGASSGAVLATVNKDLTSPTVESLSAEIDDTLVGETEQMQSETPKTPEWDGTAIAEYPERKHYTLEDFGEEWDARQVAGNAQDLLNISGFRIVPVMVWDSETEGNFYLRQEGQQINLRSWPFGTSVDTIVSEANAFIAVFIAKDLNEALPRVSAKGERFARAVLKKLGWVVKIKGVISYNNKTTQLWFIYQGKMYAIFVKNDKSFQAIHKYNGKAKNVAVFDTSVSYVVIDTSVETPTELSVDLSGRSYTDSTPIILEVVEGSTDVKRLSKEMEAQLGVTFDKEEVSLLVVDVVYDDAETLVNFVKPTLLRVYAETATGDNVLTVFVGEKGLANFVFVFKPVALEADGLIAEYDDLPSHNTLLKDLHELAKQ